MLATVAVAATGSLRAQTPEPLATPIVGPATTAGPTPASTEPDSMTKAVPARKKAWPKAVLEKYDVNKDGKLDAEEVTAYQKDKPLRKAEKLKKYDKNGDGKIDDEEKIQMRVERLREADAAKKAKSTPDKP